MDGKLHLHVYIKILKVSVWIFTLIFVATELVLCANRGDVLLKTCTDTGTFRVTFGQPFEVCIEQCQRRQRCELIMYRHRINECSLKDFVDITHLTEEGSVCLFTYIENWERAGLSPCEKNSCGPSATCETSSTDQNSVKCVPSECPRPQVIHNATVLSSMHTVGYKNGYKCDRMFIGKGDPFITCKNDGTWTSANFKCSRIGKEPTSDVGIADLISVDGEKWLEGTKLNFSCRPGYQGLGVSVSSTIQRTGEWRPRAVQCCNENITQSVWGDACITTFNGSFASHISDMWTFCKDRGGHMKGVINRSLASKVLKSEGYLWLMNGGRIEKFLTLLQGCLDENEVSDLPENLTYPELVKEAVSRSLKRHWTCDTAGWWAQNKPINGDPENCVVFRNGTYDIIDVDCSLWLREERQNTGFICEYSLPKL